MFKESFKYYKVKHPVPNFSEVINFDEDSVKNTECLHIKNDEHSTDQILGLKPPNHWKCVKLIERPGLIFIRNPFTALGQRYWIARCLKDYPKNPNVVNLSPKLFKSNVIENWWNALQDAEDDDFKKKLKIAMRWTTLGYHHDWDTKIYSEQMKHKFPDDLKYLCSYFANMLNLGNYSAEAAIVNYYPVGTTLAGHTDHSEADLEAPLFSFSFGQSAIFLIGGQTMEEKPSALFLKSGDVVIMSKSSRLCYHAVPRVMKADQEPWNAIKEHLYLDDEPPNKKRFKTLTNDCCQMNLDLWSKCMENKHWEPFNNYLKDCRININVRQVLRVGQTSL